MIQFAHPEYLQILWALIPLVALLIFFRYRQRKELGKFLSSQTVEVLAPGKSRTKEFGKDLLFVLSAAMLILTAANPRVGTRMEEVKLKGIDLMVALDVSLSMKAEDIRPSRLEKAKQDVSRLLQRLRGDRIGLIVFAGEAFVQFPLTSDYSAADLFLSAADVDAVPYPGTAIGAALDLAMNSFQKDSPAQKAIIVVSDGENTVGDLLASVDRARRMNVRIFGIGQGTPSGGPIPVYRGGRLADYKRDRTGSMVLTKLDETALQQISSATGGAYLRATSGGNEVEQIFDELSKLEKAEYGALQVAGYQTVYQYPLALALLLLIIEMMMSEKRKWILTTLRKVFIRRGLPVVMILFLPLILQSQTVRKHVSDGNALYEKGDFKEAEISYRKGLEKDDRSRVALSNLGSSLYKQEQYSAAAGQFVEAAQRADTDEERADSYYNLGNTLFKENKLQESIEAYKRALRLHSEDQDARHNLELARRQLQQQQQQQKQDKKNDQQQKKEKDQKEDQQQQQRRQQQEQQQEQQRRQEQMRQQIPKEQAEAILEALKNNEKKIQERLRKREAGARVNVEKDW